MFEGAPPNVVDKVSTFLAKERDAVRRSMHERYTDTFFQPSHELLHLPDQTPEHPPSRLSNSNGYPEAIGDFHLTQLDAGEPPGATFPSGTGVQYSYENSQAIGVHYHTHSSLAGHGRG